MAAPPRRGFGKILTAPLLVFSFLSAIVVIGLDAWVVDHELNGDSLSSAPEGFEGNRVTGILISYSLIAAVAAVGLHLVGLHHVRVWTTPSASAAQAAAWVAFGLLTIPFAAAWKSVYLGGVGEKAEVLEAFVVVPTVVHFAYTLILYAPDR